ncbi:acyl-CoA carboxylase epsilon subunit [Rhodococcus kronopolitis]|uniref:Acyl-CoA carboxylase epsilon subunit n=1 Tax=Rhodococcus kronopolitis TaxID=1460226 RepID=A0ABV9FL90_9NOCA
MTDDILSETALEAVEVLSEAAAAVDAAAADSRTPFLTVVKGSPTDVDVAAMVAVFASAAAAADGAVEDTTPDRWGEPVRMHRNRAPFSPYAFQNLA